MRWALYATLLPLFGTALFDWISRPIGLLAVRPLLVLGSSVAAVLSALGIAVTTATMAGVALSDVAPADICAMLAEMAAGHAVLVRLCALLTLLILAMLRRTTASASAAVLASSLALASLAWAGHGALDEGAWGGIHLVADIVHILAAGAWLGGLLALMLIVFRPDLSRNQLELARQALAGFASTGTICIAALVSSGLVNSWLLIGPDHVSAIWTSLYGRLLLGKLVLFTLMILLAASNRFRLTPAFAHGLELTDSGRAVYALRRSLGSGPIKGIPRAILV